MDIDSNRLSFYIVQAGVARINPDVVFQKTLFHETAEMKKSGKYDRKDISNFTIHSKFIYYESGVCEI